MAVKNITGIKIPSYPNDTFRFITETDKSLNKENVAADAKITGETIDNSTTKVFNNLSFSSSSCHSDSTYADFPYKVTLTVSGMKPTMYPIVNLSLETIMSGVVSPIAISELNAVSLFVSEPISASDISIIGIPSKGV